MDNDYLIVGGGVIGLSCAERLLLRGARVAVLERGSCGTESSWAGGGILSPLCSWDYPAEVNRLAHRGASLFQGWAASLFESTGIDPEYWRCGMKVLPPFDRQAALTWTTAHGAHVIEEEGALVLPEVAQVRNPRLLRALRRRVEMLGGDIVESCAVHQIEAEHGHVVRVRTGCGDFQADSYIVAAGAWSAQVMSGYIPQLEVRPIRGQMLLFKFADPPLRQVYLRKDLYLIPRRDGHLLVGSTLEDVGFDKGITQAAHDDLLRRAAVLLPQLRDSRVVRQWAGLRPGSPNNIPVIGRHPHLHNLYVNSGHFRYGVTMAPASAELLINELCGTPQAIDATPYRMVSNGQ